MKRKRNAFTLSEILLTLVIIGVVSALTLPFCYAAYQEHLKSVKVKKFYKDMNDVLEETFMDDSPYTPPKSAFQGLKE